MRRRITIALAVLWLQAHAIIGAQAPARDDVNRALACFADTWNRHDIPALAQCFTADADLVNVSSDWWKGHDAIRQNLAFLHGTVSSSETTGVTVPARSYGIFKATVHAWRSIELRLLRPDVAIVHATWSMTGDARTTEPRTGLMTLVVVPDGDRWRIAAFQNTETARKVN